MKIDILSLFPAYFKGPFDESIIKRAKASQLVEIELIDMRAFAEGKHSKADDRPYGGGPGMVLKPDVVTRAIRSVKKDGSKVIYLSPQGSLLTAAKSRELAQCEHLILLCGHYEGVDERALDSDVDEEISIGDYVLTNGCLPAIVLVDSLLRFVPGVLGHAEASAKDSFEDGLFDHPHFTHPLEFEGKRVPQVLQEGDHSKIERWRREKALEKTRAIRPDLFVEHLSAFENQKIETEAEVIVTLFVKSLKKSLEFYCKKLKWNVVEKNQTSARLEYLGAHLTLIETPFVVSSYVEMVIKDKVKFQVFTKGLGKIIEDPDGHLWNIKISKEHENEQCSNR